MVQTGHEEEGDPAVGNQPYSWSARQHVRGRDDGRGTQRKELMEDRALQASPESADARRPRDLPASLRAERAAQESRGGRGVSPRPRCILSSRRGCTSAPTPRAIRRGISPLSRARCVSTVLMLTPRSKAIALFGFPASMPSRTRRCRGLRSARIPSGPRDAGGDDVDAIVDAARFDGRPLSSSQARRSTCRWAVSSPRRC